jgi:site-specific recombinase XerD
VRGAREVIARIAATAELDHTTAHVLRHVFAATPLRGGTALVLVAELVGHARLGPEVAVQVKVLADEPAAPTDA